MTTQIVEHIVLFDLKKFTDESKIESLRNGLKDLVTIDGVLHLSAGDIHGNRSTSSNYNLILHSRFKSKEDLRSYLNDPKHISLLGELMNPIADGVLLLDWLSDVQGPVVPPPGSAMRVRFFKLKEGFVDSQKEKVLEVLKGLKDHFGTTHQHTYGENFNHKDASGYTIACIVIFPGIEALDALDSTEDVNKQLEKIKDLVDTVVEVDYVI